MKKEGQREYRLNRRAESQAETRARIIDAVVALHEEVGPALTTVVEIAERAKVSRPTVYSHFPDERSLFRACSAHWVAANPRPDPTLWTQIENPRQRLRVALLELYDYYEQHARMLGNVLRDAALMPSLSEAVQHTVGSYTEAAVQALAVGREGGRRKRNTLVPALRLALSFQAWQILTKSGLLTKGAASLMSSFVEAA